ncbi:MAG: hypothetical protein JNL72_12670 [Flavipsychrobacter sp.]|nr:hypothetical protein [Flavipsychrobacter sp.]
MKRFLFCIGFAIASVASYAQEQAEAPKYELVERNRRMPFVTSDGYVKQDNKVITYYTIEKAGETGKKFRYTLPNGTAVAEAFIKHDNMGKMVVTTMIDNKKHTVGVKNITEMDIAREVAMFLSDNKYL